VGNVVKPWLEEGKKRYVAVSLSHKAVHSGVTCLLVKPTYI